MDWIASAINEPINAAISGSIMNSKKDELTSLNFDHLQQQQTGPASSQGHSSPLQQPTNKAQNLDLFAATAAASGPLVDLNPNVRTHPTKMQRYLQALQMQTQTHPSQNPNSQQSATSMSKSMEIFQAQMAMKGHDNGSSLASVLGSSVLGSSMQPSQPSHSNNVRVIDMSQPRSSNTMRVIDMSHGGGTGSSNNTYRRTSSPRTISKTNSLSKNSPSSSPDTTSKSRQKNDKAVQVHCPISVEKVICRFRTQTECARYLRATPEAVSYHCSKGGGICNGLVIRPLVGSVGSVKSFQEIHDLEAKAGDSGDVGGEGTASYFGLFEGSTEARPAKRPQLKPETVSILKDWLLSPEHMDNPYPNQRESEYLMQQTGLDKTQLKHWFNNARKRILKPLLKNGVRGLGKKKGEKGGKGKKGKKRGGEAQVGGLSNVTEKDGPAKKKRKNDTGSGREYSGEASTNDNHMDPSLMPNGSSLCGSISTAGTNGTHKMSANLTSSQQQQQRRMPPFDGSYQDQQQDYRHKNSDSSNSSTSIGGANNGNTMQNHMIQQSMQQSTEYDRLMGYGNNNTNSSMHNRIMSNGLSQARGNDPMMCYGGDSMTNMMTNSQARMLNHHRRQSGGGMGMEAMYNPGRSSGSILNSMGGAGMGGAGFHGCMEVGNDPQGFDGNGRFSDYPPSRGNNGNNSNGHNRQSFQDNDYTDDGKYCQPLSHQPNQAAASRNNQDASSSANPSSSLDEAGRSNAVFKQQVATMAMNEASTSFKEMEDAFALAKEVTAQHGNAQDGDPRVLEANAHAKKCQSVAMFKLKVSQRASEEAASAYDCYQRMVEGGGGPMVNMGIGGGSDSSSFRTSLGGNDPSSFRASLGGNAPSSFRASLAGNDPSSFRTSL